MEVDLSQRVLKLERLLAELIKWTGFKKNTIKPDLDTINENDDNKPALAKISRGSIPRRQGSDLEEEDLNLILKVEIDDSIGDDGVFPQEVADNDEFGFEPEWEYVQPILMPENEESNQKLKGSPPPPPPKSYSPLTVPSSSTVSDADPVVRMERLLPQLRPLKSPSNNPHCNTSWKDKSALNKHVSKSHPMATCHSVSQNERRHLPSSKRLYNCPHCHQTSSYGANMRRHILTHTGERPHSCPHCSAKFRTTTALKYHNSVTHSTLPEKKFACPQCPYKTHHLPSLRSHLRHVHEKSEREWLCDKCSKTFKFSKQLKKHLRNVHEHFSLFLKCYFCGKGFKERSSLQRHLYCHTGEKYRRF